LVAKSDGADKNRLESRGEDNNKMNLKDINLENIGWINVEDQ
jgi:hypothetical protein